MPCDENEVGKDLVMFLTTFEQALTSGYLKEGHLIRPVADTDALQWMRSQFVNLVIDDLKLPHDVEPDRLLNDIHKYVPVSGLNNFRLRIIRGINAIPEFRHNYFKLAKPYLEALVGNELAMQIRVNLSIQFPNDDSSLLPVHADTWSGDSPFEAVVWVPMVDCFKTKAMYIMNPTAALNLTANFLDLAGDTSEDLYQNIKDEVKFIDVRYGEVLVFNQGLPHGNRINIEDETRWSMNCRFKGIFTPYGDKKIGEFFEPVTLRAASRYGIGHRLPVTI